ncbi:hypothetical protein FO519_003225 [Halicephalobus sp. NKZ332]|nr:hypothetical protein FO519_003225 [Halicephalobus sp. NKZ332]
MSCVMLSLFYSWKILKIVAWTTTTENFFGRITSPKVIYIFAFGVPTLLAIGFGAGTKLDFFYRNDNFCWIRADFVIAGVVVPLTILGVNAIICSFIITLRYFPGLKIARIVRGASVIIARGKKRDVKERIIFLVFVQFTLGVPWLLQYLTLFSSEATVYHYLFSIVNGSQGIILLCYFGFRCYRIGKAMKGQYLTSQLSSSDDKSNNRTEFFSKGNNKNDHSRSTNWTAIEETVSEEVDRTPTRRRPEIISNVTENSNSGPVHYDSPPGNR